VPSEHAVRRRVVVEATREHGARRGGGRQIAP
jgi:hypothetical protein